MKNVYFDGSYIHYYDELIDIKSIPDILGHSDYYKFKNYVKNRLKGVDIRLIKY